MRSSAWLAAAVALLQAGCNGGGGDSRDRSAGSVLLDELDPIAIESSSLAAAFSIASAPNLYAMAVFPSMVANVSTDGCPVVELTDSGTTVTGGCTDAAGTLWTGEMRLTGFSDVDIELDGFSFASTSSCGTFALPGSALLDGRARLLQENAGVRFEADLVLDARGSGCPGFENTIALDYAGRATNGPDANVDGEPDYSLWNGAGRLGLEGVGRVHASTEDERLDGTSIGSTPGEGATFTDPPCLTEAASGRTELRAGGHIAELLYDGAVACEAGSVPWSLDGEAQGSLSGVSCSATASSGRSPLGALAVLALCVFARRTRR